MPRTRSKWMPTANGWRWGRYQIECLAPRLWVLTEMGADLPGAVSSPTIITTSASVRTLKYLAERRETRVTRRRVMWTHSLVGVAAALGLLAASLLPSPAVIVATVALMFVMLRSVAIVAVVATDGAWTRVRHTYQ